MNRTQVSHLTPLDRIQVSRPLRRLARYLMSAYARSQHQVTIVFDQQPRESHGFLLLLTRYHRPSH